MKPIRGTGCLNPGQNVKRIPKKWLDVYLLIICLRNTHWTQTSAINYNNKFVEV